MAKRDRKCYLCGENYKYCPTCSQDKMKPSWMAEFHNENCKNIFNIATRFNLKLLTKAEAKAEMDKCDLSNRENFKAYVQRDLENIYAQEKPEVKAVEAKPFANKVKYNSHEVVNEEE